jgi:hypothetical protein
VLATIADTLDQLVADVVAMMNADATLDEIVHTVRVPADTLALPYLRPLYDEPEFVVRNGVATVRGVVGRRCQPAEARPRRPARHRPRRALRRAGGSARARRAGRSRPRLPTRRPPRGPRRVGRPDDPDIHRGRAAVYRARRAVEPSLMSKGIYAAAARESEAIAARADDVSPS